MKHAYFRILQKTRITDTESTKKNKYNVEILKKPKTTDYISLFFRALAINNIHLCFTWILNDS